MCSWCLGQSLVCVWHSIKYLSNEGMDKYTFRRLADISAMCLRNYGYPMFVDVCRDMQCLDAWTDRRATYMHGDGCARNVGYGCMQWIRAERIY